MFIPERFLVYGDENPRLVALSWEVVQTRLAKLMLSILFRPTSMYSLHNGFCLQLGMVSWEEERQDAC